MIVLPPLPYAYDALQPVLSPRTLKAHHDAHHARYVEEARDLAFEAGLQDHPLESIIGLAAGLSDRRLFNNAAQAWNHGFLWNSMAAAPSRPKGPLDDAIAARFGDVEALGEAFVEAGAAHFGSGWVWLCSDHGTLGVFTTHDAATAVRRPLTPLLACDLWEHAYYLDHEEDRKGFLAAWWRSLANWDFAARQFAASLGEAEPWRYPTGPDAYVPPIHEPGAFEHALEEAGLLLEAEPGPGSAARVRFDALLERIAGYHLDQPEAAAQADIPAELDRRIRNATARVLAREREGHWAPMVGGDLRSHPTPNS